MLQAFDRLYDPLGLLAPFTIHAKIIFQGLWKLRHPWDSPLPPAKLDAWNSWCADVSDLKRFSLARHAFSMDDKARASPEINVFADASPMGYGTVVYVRSSSMQAGKWEVHLLLRKGRIAPIEATSLPRLELLTCLIAARLFDFLKLLQYLSEVRSFFWTDSKSPCL